MSVRSVAGQKRMNFCYECLLFNFQLRPTNSSPGGRSWRCHNLISNAILRRMTQLRPHSRVRRASLSACPHQSPRSQTPVWWMEMLVGRRLVKRSFNSGIPKRSLGTRGEGTFECPLSVLFLLGSKLHLVPMFAPPILSSTLPLLPR
jgi:hypothetical protein